MNATYLKREDIDVTISEPGLLSAADAKKVPAKVLEGRGGFWLRERTEHGAMAVQNDGFVFSEDYSSARLDIIPSLTIEGLPEADQNAHTTVIINGISFTAMGNDKILCDEAIGCGSHNEAILAVKEWGEKNFAIGQDTPSKDAEER